MAYEKKKPATALHSGAGSMDVHSSPASDIRITIESGFQVQQEFFPIAWLAARTGVALSTARIYAELHNFGGARG